MTNLDPARYAADYGKSLDWEKPFFFERPALHSPAAAAQEGGGEVSIMWRFISQLQPWQYTSFTDESMAFHDAAYLGDWTSLPKFRIKGPDALKFMSAFTVNNFGKFNPGQIKHAIRCNQEGKVAGEGVLFKAGEHDFRYMGGAAFWLNHWFKSGAWNGTAELYTAEEFVFVIQGPKSLAILEQATGDSFRDIKFSHQRMTQLNGHDVRILRSGITGELGYEIHGPVAIGNEIWEAIYAAGKPHGMRRLGGRSMLVSHVEGCFPTIGRDFIPATSPTMGHSKAHKIDTSNGSYEWSDPKQLMRSPFELNWDREVSLDTHDFLGRDALIKERDAGGPRQKLVGLKWNSADVVGVYAASFEQGALPTPMELPRAAKAFALSR